MTIIKLICSASCALMVLGAIIYAGVASLRAAVRPAPRTGPREDARAAVQPGTGG